MSVKEKDFVFFRNKDGLSILVNVSKIQFIVPDTNNEEYCDFFFGTGEDDFISVKTDLDKFLDMLS